MPPPNLVVAKLRELLSSLCGIDEPEVLDYLAAGLVEDEDAEADELADSLAGFSPSYAALPPAEQQHRAAELLRRAAELKAEAQAARAAPTCGAAAPTSTEGKPALAAVVSQTLSRLSSLSVGGGGAAGSSAASSQCGSDDEAGGGAGWTPQQQAAVCTLREACAVPPDISDAFLGHVLSDNGGGDMQAAAAWMLEDCPDLGEAQRAWQQARQRRREERARAAAEQEAAKRQIVSRFQLQAVANGTGDGKGKPVQLAAWGADGKGTKGGTKEDRVRFRDGMVASRSGQKYVIEKEGEDWDGGSRGKVISKGKRGKGFY